MAKRYHFTRGARQLFYPVHPMRKYFELLLYEVYTSERGKDTYPDVAIKEYNELSPVQISKTKLKERVSTKDDRFHTRMYCADRIAETGHYDVRVLLFDYLLKADIPEEIDLAFDGCTAGAYRLANTAKQRRVVDAMVMNSADPIHKSREMLEKLGDYTPPTLEDIAIYVYFFWNLNPQDSPSGLYPRNLLSWKIMHLAKEFSQSYEIPIPYLDIGDVTQDPDVLRDQTIPWPEFAIGLEAEPLDSYFYALKRAGDKITRNNLILGLGLNDNTQKIIEQGFRDVLVNLVQSAREAAQDWDWIKARAPIDLASSLSRTMKDFDIPYSDSRADLSDQYEVNMKEPGDYALSEKGYTEIPETPESDESEGND